MQRYHQRMAAINAARPNNQPIAASKTKRLVGSFSDASISCTSALKSNTISFLGFDKGWN